MVWCPDCKYFGQDCNPEPEEYDLPCESYEHYVEEQNNWESLSEELLLNE